MFVADPREYPWSIPFQPSYRLEGQMYAKYILDKKPNAKIGILYQNDDLGRDYLNGLKDGLGDKFDKMVVKTLSYEVTDPTIDSQVLQLQAAGADLFYDASTPKFAAMTIRKAADIDWHPLHIIDSNGSSVKPALESAGLEKSVGIVTAQYLKDPTDPGWADDAGMEEFPGLAGEICSRQRPRQRRMVLWLYDGAGYGRGSETGRKRPVARKHHEGRDQPAGHDNASNGAARDQDQHQPDRFFGR